MTKPIPGRTKPQQIAQFTQRETYNCTEIFKAKAVYSVLHAGQPIGMKTFNALINDQSVRYKKTSFPTIGQARALARRLNALFKTNQFEVHEMVPGEKVYAQP